VGIVPGEQGIGETADEEWQAIHEVQALLGLDETEDRRD
jgi:hypothetical protein